MLRFSAKKRNFEKSLKTGTALVMGVERVDRRLLGPVLAGFFIMGFCDMVAPITGRIAAEFPAERQAAVSFLPTMVFLWFLVLSTPVAALMNRWGRKATALLGYGFTVAGLMLPYAAGADCALGWYFAGFGLLGIGNTAIQVAVNPLLATIVPAERMTSYLTVGQIFRNNPAPPSNPMGIRVDSKRRKKLMQKRLAMGHKQDDHEQEQGYGQVIR